MQGEEWKLVEGTEDYYISSLGRFKKGKKFRKTTPNKEGYCTCNIGKNKYLVHRLVAKAFVPNPDNFPIVDHIDGCKTNNNKDNLRWVDYCTNVKSAYDIGLNKGSEVIPILVIDSADNVRLFSSQAEAAEAVGITPNRISKVVRGIDKQCNGYRFFRCRKFEDCRSERILRSK